MSLLLLRRLAIIATPILFLAAATALSLSARADDAPQAAHEAAVLDRIFANWKARHDRVHSLHFKWDCRTTYRKGALDPSILTRPRKRFERDQAFEQFGVQLFIDGERRCGLFTPLFKVPQAKLSDTLRVVTRAVIDGDTSYDFTTGSWYETGAPSPRQLPRGFLYRSFSLRWMADQSIQAPLLTFRPQFPIASWRREQCHLVDENASVDNGHYVKIQRVAPLRRVESCWISPARDDVVVHWEVQTPQYSSEGSIKYKKDPTYGWIPSEWTSGSVGHSLSECKMTSYAINEKIDPKIFALEFPAGTPVDDQQDAKAERYYVVQPDGSKRMISPQEYSRLAFSDPPKNKVPAKPQAK